MSCQELDLIILKHILTSKKNALEFTHECNEKLFAPDTWRFTKLILDYIKLYKELPTRKVINERLKASKNDTFLSYVNKIWDDVEGVHIDEKEYKHDLEKIKNRFTERLIYDLKNNLVSDDGRVDLKKSVAELTATVNHIKGITQVKSYEQKSLKEGIKEFRDSYGAKLKDSNYGVGIKTGYSFFDFATSGMYVGEMCIIGAETNGGKSMLLSNIAYNMWVNENDPNNPEATKEGNDILYFSLEMPWKDCQERVMARLALVPQVNIRDAKLTTEESASISRGIKFIEGFKSEFYIVDMPRGATMEAIELVYNDIVAMKGRRPKVVVIDYLTLMSCDEEEADWLKTGKLAEKFHEFCRVNEVVGLTATQLNRAKPGAGSAMSVDRIARSSLQAANANFVIMIEKRPNEHELPNLNVSLVKNRRGQLANGTLYKKYDCCALLNSPESETAANTAGDISDEID
jgi:replicative DNA helicase